MVCLDQEEFQVVSNDVKTCTVAGRYRAYTNPERGEVRSEKQRVTFCWRYENKELKIVHIHLSNADFPQEGGKQFPLQDSDENKEFMKMLMTQRSQSAMLTVKDCSGVTRVIDYTNIIYIKPAHNYSVIMCAEGEREIRVRQTLCELAEKLPNRFMQVSRSCVVNLHYVNRLGRQMAAFRRRHPAESTGEQPCIGEKKDAVEGTGIAIWRNRSSLRSIRTQRMV